ncbi:FtsX-like permease family protein [uncultured Anaerococcus sp.]|uniref:FtsX-like permease family protein n=1 Tax=uncultured Anaerococcus sp. TaxID=293428 RepID=UPI00288B098C|nr:FtsX-like permease family protein [uncultured Anaerococcus sp.]
MKRSQSSKKLYLLILIISSITSYIILSIDKSEVFSYIYEENRYYLLDTVRLIYLVSLIFIFILIYYASFYMISERKNDIGLLMAEGLGQKKLFKLLFKDSLKDLLRANILGLSISIFINEFINLLTVKVLSLGLTFHNFSVSFKAIILTLAISLFLNSLSIYTIVRDFYKKNPDEIFRGEIRSRSDSFLFLALVLFLLGTILNYDYFWEDLLVLLSIISIFLLILFFILSKILQKTSGKNLIVRKSLSLTFKKDKASLLFTSFMLIVGTLILAYTILTSIASRNALERPADFTLYDSKEKIDILSKDQDMAQMIGEIYPVFGYEYWDIDASELIDLVKANISLDRQTKNDFYFEPGFLLRESSFENIYKIEADLGDDEAILLAISENEKYALEETLAKKDSSIIIGGKNYRVRKLIKSNKIFSNDVIGLASMVVVNDKVYDSLISKKEPFAYNINLSKDFVNSFGFSKGSDMLRQAFIDGGYKYESYIWQAKNAISQITENLYTYFYLSLIFILAGLSFFTIRIFILFEKSKEKLRILSLMGQDMDEIRAIIRKEYTTLFLTVGLVSIIVSIFLFTKIPYTMNIFFKLKLSKIIGSLALISMALLLLMGLFLRFILRMSYERILNYEEDFNN